MRNQGKLFKCCLHAGTCSTVCLRRCVVLQNPVLHLLLNAVHEELHDALLNRGEASGAAHKGTLLVDVLGKNENCVSITVCPGLPRQLARALFSLGSNVLENNHKKGSPLSCVFHLHGLCYCCGKLLLALWQVIRHFLLQTSRQIRSLFSSIASRAILLPLRSHIFVRLVHDIHTCLAFPCSCHLATSAARCAWSSSVDFSNNFGRRGSPDFPTSPGNRGLPRDVGCFEPPIANINTYYTKP